MDLFSYPFIPIGLCIFIQVPESNKDQGDAAI